MTYLPYFECWRAQDLRAEQIVPICTPGIPEGSALIVSGLRTGPMTFHLDPPRVSCEMAWDSAVLIRGIGTDP